MLNIFAIKEAMRNANIPNRTVTFRGASNKLKIAFIATPKINGTPLDTKVVLEKRPMLSLKIRTPTKIARKILRQIFNPIY